MPEDATVNHEQVDQECEYDNQEYRSQTSEDEAERNSGHANYREHCGRGNNKSPEIVDDKELDDEQQCCYYLRSCIKSVNWGLARIVLS